MNRFLAKLFFAFFICIGISSTLISCKAKAKVIDVNNTKSSTKITSDKIIKNHYDNISDFNTLYIKSNVKYNDDKMSQNVTAEIKIKKDEQILISIRFLGITMAKASITPTVVSYYEKMGSTYFEGDFSSLSQWLGTDLDFMKVQNLLIGQAVEDLTKKNYQDSLIDQSYRLEEISKEDIKKYFFFDEQKFLLNKQEIVQDSQNRKVGISYSDYKLYNTILFPSKIDILAEQEKGKTEIVIEHNSMTLNETLSFPYSVPSGYKRILIK
jgi:hypothetical protein